MNKLLGVLGISIVVFAQTGEVGAITPESGTIFGGGVVDRSTQTAVADAQTDVGISMFDAAEDGTPLFLEDHSTEPLTNGGFALALQSDPGDLGSDSVFLEFSIASEPASPRLQLTPILSNDLVVALELREFSRETPASAITVSASLSQGADEVDVSARVLDTDGNILAGLGSFIMVPVVAGVFTLPPLSPIPGAALAEKTVRVLEISIDEARVGGAPVLGGQAFRIPLTYVSSNFCVELLHLLEPSAALPMTSGGDFGCLASEPPGGGDPPGGEDPSELTQRVDQLESEVGALQSQVGVLEGEVTTLQSQVTELQERIGELERTAVTRPPASSR